MLSLKLTWCFHKIIPTFIFTMKTYQDGNRSSAGALVGWEGFAYSYIYSCSARLISFKINNIYIYKITTDLKII